MKDQGKMMAEINDKIIFWVIKIFFNTQ